jgi:peptidoglycan/LPS O-acetylase OafA/YrhL
MPGGSASVDIFFVISGYLITSIIDREMHQKCFSLPSFYDRRIRRIFPALIGLSSITTAEYNSVWR